VFKEPKRKSIKKEEERREGKGREGKGREGKGGGRGRCIKICNIYHGSLYYIA
jgi:hypothetical protein